MTKIWQTPSALTIYLIIIPGFSLTKKKNRALAKRSRVMLTLEKIDENRQCSPCGGGDFPVFFPHWFFQWIGLRENLQETIDFPIKYRGFPVNFPLNQCIDFWWGKYLQEIWARPAHSARRRLTSYHLSGLCFAMKQKCAIGKWDIARKK